MMSKHLLSSTFAVLHVILSALVYFAVSRIVPSIENMTAAVIAVNISAAAFVGFDKIIAGNKGVLRIPETGLYLAAILGGAIGVLTGMQLFRHKTQKPRVGITVSCIGLAQVVVYVYAVS